MKVEQREQLILERLNTNGKVMNREIAAEVGVSDMTIRRDVERLERSQLLQRVHGGAVVSGRRSFEPPFSVRSRENLDQKRQIADMAANLVSPGDSVVLDSGTTAVAVAEAIRGTPGLTVLAMSLWVAVTLADEADMEVLCSGSIRAGERSLTGDLAAAALQSLHFDIAFLTSPGISVAEGLTEYNLEDARVKKSIIAATSRSVVVADSSKLGIVAFANVANLDEIDTLITDHRADVDMVQQVETAGVEVLVAGP